MIFRFEFEIGTHDKTSDPVLEIAGKTFTLNQTNTNIEFACESNQFTIEWKNKTGNDTVCDAHGNIIADKFIKFKSAWIDGILAEPWFLTESVYYPNYFPGISGPEAVHSPYIISFPGKIVFKYELPFWEYYKNKRISYMDIKNLDKDPDRVWKYAGSYDMHSDIVEELELLLDRLAKHE